MANGNILVVDDLTDWRSMIGGLLSDAGYQVQVAEDEDAAMRLLRRQPYHVAVVDLRLDERDEANRAGLALAKRMKEYAPELAIIILTAYADVASVKSAFERQPNGGTIAFDFLEKHETAKLLASVRMAFENGARVNPHLEVVLESPLGWEELRNDIDCLVPFEVDEAKSEIVDLLQRLFYDTDHITVKPLGEGHSSGSAVLVSASFANVLQADVVAKFDERKKAQQEASNYDKYVAKYLGGARRTQRLDFRATARLGGIAYSFVGGNPAQFHRFGDVYRTSSIKTVKQMLDNLFLETCHTWYVNPISSDTGKQSLGSCYRGWLCLNNTKLRTALQEIIRFDEECTFRLTSPGQPHQSALEMRGMGVTLTAPLLRSNSAFSYDGPFYLTHGDLHENNILVDNHNQTWLLDFYQTGPSHPARDFALLEGAVKFYLQASHCPLTTLLDWERSLLNVPDLAKPLVHNWQSNLDQELQKATGTVLHIRTLLAQLAPQVTLQDYFIALYFHALKGMTLSTKFSQRQRLHALGSAALLAEALA